MALGLHSSIVRVDRTTMWSVVYNKSRLLTLGRRYWAGWTGRSIRLRSRESSGRAPAASRSSTAGCTPHSHSPRDTWPFQPGEVVGTVVLEVEAADLSQSAVVPLEAAGRGQKAAVLARLVLGDLA